MSEQAPLRIYEKDRATFERLRALPMEQLLKQPVATLPLAVRAASYCEKKNLATIGQLALAKRADMLKARNMGRKTVQHIEMYLRELGLGLDGKIAASVPAPIPPAYARGAQAMRLAIMTQLVALDVPHMIVQQIAKMELPQPEDR